VTRELADLAEAIVTQVAIDQWERRTSRHGTPLRNSDGRRDRWAILGLGKLGGRELNYHSDLDLVFLHEEDGQTSGDRQSVSNEQFHTEVARRVLKALGGDPATGPLYQVDTRLRPHGASGPLTVTLEGFRRYLTESAQTWERLAMTRARVIYATGGFGRVVNDSIRSILCSPVDHTGLAKDVRAMRRRLEDSRGRKDLKRGNGGLADLEFIAQYLILASAPRCPELLRTNLWEAFDALRDAGILPPPVHQELVGAYDFLRTVEGRLRLVHNRACADLPDTPDEILSLARRLNYRAADPDEAVESFHRDSVRHAAAARSAFEQIVQD